MVISDHKVLLFDRRLGIVAGKSQAKVSAAQV